MIKLENIYIKFDDYVIKNGSIVLNSGSITLLTGKSGSGKSSLLNLIGLISQSKQCDYYINDKKIDVHNEKVVCDYQRNDIAYVFQDYNLIEEMSVLDNFKWMFDLVNKDYSVDKVKELLKLVNLDVKFEQKVKQLSGGERQRLAIAIFLVKEPTLILLDEPAASLDETNQKALVGLLHKLRDLGKIIVIATHQPEIYAADSIYVIENQCLKSIKENVITGDFFKQNHYKLKEKFYIKHALRRLNNNGIINAIFITIFAFIIGISSVLLMDNITTLNVQMNRINNISNNEIMLMNIVYQDTDGVIGSNFENGNEPDIPINTINSIKENENVSSVYPYVKFTMNRSSNYYNENMDKITPTVKEALSVVIRKNDEVINELFWPDNKMNEIALVSYDKHNLDEVKIDTKYDKKNGVYLSESLAKILDITDCSDLNMEINLEVPVAQFYGKYLSGKYVGQMVPVPLMIYKNFKFPINGIIKDLNSSQFYDYDRDCEMYMDVDEMIKLRDEVHRSFMENKDKFDAYYTVEGNKFFDEDYLTHGYIIRVNDYKKIEDVNKEILLEDSHFVTKTKFNEIKVIDNVVKQNMIAHLGLPVGVGGVVIILMCIVFYYRNKRFAKELALIKTNGVNYIEKIILYELIILAVMIFILSIVIGFVISVRIPYIDYYGLLVLVPLVCSALLIIIPYLTTGLKVKNVDVSVLVKEH